MTDPVQPTPSNVRSVSRSRWRLAIPVASAVSAVAPVRGSAFGLHLAVDEVVVSCDPPRQESWRTEGKPRLVVVTGYDMGFDMSSDEPAASQVRTWIRYQLQRIRGLLGIVALFLSHLFARWCVNRMLADAIRTFEAAPVPSV